jgi:Domain of unknown function (DUF4375)
MKRPNIIILIRNEQERLEFLQAGVDLPKGRVTPEGEMVSFYLAEDDPRWRSVGPLVRKRIEAQVANFMPKDRPVIAKARNSTAEKQVPHLEWLSGYSGQTTEELISLEGTYRTDSLVLAFEQAIDQKEFEYGKNRLSRAERIIQAVEALEREVNNGGYSQFFKNSSREFAPVIVESLQSIGCMQVASITEMATSALDIPDLTPSSIESAMSLENEPLRKKLTQFDDAYYHAGEAIADRLFAFIKQKKAEIKL